MILLIGHEASLTGAPKSLLFFSKWVKENKDEQLCFILRSGGPLLEEYQKLGEVLLWNLPLTKKSLTRRAFDRLFNRLKSRRVKFLKRIKKDVSIIYNNTCTNGLILEEVKAYLGKPLVSRIPELELVIQHYKMRGISKDTFKLSDGIVAVSQAVKNNLVENHDIPEEKIKMCYGAIPDLQASNHSDKATLRRDLGLPTDAFIVGGVGTLIWRKGYDLFIDLAIRFKAVNAKQLIYFLWVGGQEASIPYLELKKQIKIHGLDKTIQFVPSTKNIYAYYQTMDIFFLSSREDPFPLASLEAAQAGLPVICFNHAGGGDELVDDSLGFVVDFEDINAVSDRISLLQDNQKLRQALSKGALQRIKSFNIHDSAKSIYDFVCTIRSEKAY